MLANTWIRVCLHMILAIQMIEDAWAYKAGCGSPLGMQSGVITNAQIRASSSQHDQYSPPYAARLFNTRSNVPFSFGAWCAKHRNVRQYLLIDLLSVKNITGISSQGLRVAGEHWVSSYSISYSCDGRLWLPYTLGGVAKVFDANNDTDSVVRNNLPTPIVARVVRIHPISWNHWGSICARIEIHGCDSTQVCLPTAKPTSPPPRTTKKYTTAHALNTRTLSTQSVISTSKRTTTQKVTTQPPCTSSLGMENNKIKDSQITASSFKNTLTRPSSARLNNRLKNTLSFGSWCASTADNNQYLQIDLLTPTTIVAIATQGMASPEGNWVTSYKVSYSCDGTNWFLYEYRGKQKVLQGNSDSHNTVTHYLQTPLTTRLVRLKPVTWNALGEICLRMELYGCTSSQVCAKGNISESALPFATTPTQETHKPIASVSIPTMRSEPNVNQDWTKPTNQTRATKQKKRIVIIYKKIEDDVLMSCSSRNNINIIYLTFMLLQVLACIT